MLKKLIGMMLAMTFIMSVFAAPSLAVPKVDPATVKQRKATIHRSLLNIYLAQQRKDDCLREYPILIGLQPDDSKLRYEYGLFLSRFGNKGQSITHLKKAAEMDPTNADISGALGTTYIQMKNYEEGCKWLRQAAGCPGGEKYRKPYEDAYKYMAYQKQREIYKKKQEQYKKKLEERKKAAEKATEDDDDDW
ncbi:hypothetical protein GC174_11195 [bacterium]|nr:hypothetical protein [bacterium]